MNAYAPIVYGLLSEAFAWHEKRQYEKARPLYQAVLKIDPHHADALHLLGVLESDLGNNAQAVTYIRKALMSNPRMVPALVNLGSALKSLKKLDEALAAYDKAIALDAHFALAHFNRGNLLRDWGKLPEALESFQTAARLQPQDADAHNNCGAVLWKQGAWEESLPHFDRALALNPEHIEAQINKARALQDLLRFDEGLAIYDKLLALHPTHPKARVNRGALLEEMGRDQDAIAEYLRVHEFAPQNKDAYWNEGLCKLKLGDFRQGWELYEWRWRGPEAVLHRSTTKLPQWRGEPLQGRKILIYAEQGFGDSLQFCRYIEQVAQLGAEVIFEAQVPLHGLFRNLAGVSRLIAPTDTLPKVDFQCALLSVPHVLGTTLDTIPARVPYLSADPERSAQWQARIGEARGKRVAIIWDSTTKTADEFKRVLRAEQLAPLFSSGLADFYVAQKVIKPVDREVLAQHANVHIFDDALTDFSDTAALLSHMDGVISIDTSVAHLAGALGKPTWIMLPHIAEWRWLTGREDSPWYPTARLFRQPTYGDWHSVFQAMLVALRE